MNCQHFAAALVDEHLAPPPGLQAHLSRCPECAALARLHASATALRLAEPPLPAPLEAGAIYAEVGRRRRRRQRGAGLAATAALALLALTVSTWREVPVPLPEAVSEGGVAVEGSAQVVRTGAETSAGGGEEAAPSLAVLFHQVDTYTRTQPVREDAVYAPFGALAAWVRPPDATALDAAPFATALAAFYPSQSRLTVE